MINDQQCNHPFRLGRDSDVMKVAHRKKEEHTTVASSDKA